MRRFTALIVCLVALAGVGRRPRTGTTTLKSSVFASGKGIFHTTPKGREAISQPDDITSLGGDIFVAFQNGVGPQGQASPTGNLDSTVVEFDARGHAVEQWDLVGKCDGLTADPQTGKVIATVNEDAHSSLYLIEPGGAAVHYPYDEPLPRDGGTDAISIYHGHDADQRLGARDDRPAAPQARYPPSTAPRSTPPRTP